MRGCIAQQINDLEHKALKATHEDVDYEHVSFKLKNRIEVKLTASELDLLESYMQLYGLTRQQAIIYCLRHALANAPLITNDQIMTLRESTDELRRVGINLNQIAYLLNSERASNERLKSHDIDRFLEENAKVQVQIKKQLESLTALISEVRARPDLRITFERKEKDT